MFLDIKRERTTNTKCDFPFPYAPMSILALSVEDTCVLSIISSIMSNVAVVGINPFIFSSLPRSYSMLTEY